MKALTWWESLTVTEQIKLCFMYPFNSEGQDSVQVIKTIYERHMMLQYTT